ncbi:MAG: hypothetical protein NZ516_09420, partial [Raineya sp.]|nr:hypothetical protein [Raineya sp.]
MQINLSNHKVPFRLALNAFCVRVGLFFCFLCLFLCGACNAQKKTEIRKADYIQLLEKRLESLE